MSSVYSPSALASSVSKDVEQTFLLQISGQELVILIGIYRWLRRRICKFVLLMPLMVARSAERREWEEKEV